MKAFKDLFEFYKETDNSVNLMNKSLTTKLEKKDYRELSIISSDLQQVKSVRDRLKKIIVENFVDELNKEIEDTQKVYEKEHDYAVGAWNMYGSELAGDFNSGEVKAQKKLNLLKGLLK